MIKNDKVYHIISICNFLLHICLFVFVVIVGFLPFCENRNFYDCFIGFFGKTLSIVQPYLVMAILFLSCVGAFFAIKRPLFSFLVVFCSISFFVIATLPYCIEATMVSFVSHWIDRSMSKYGIGFDLIAAVSYIVYFDVTFLMYSFATLFIRPKRKL